MWCFGHIKPTVGGGLVNSFHSGVFNVKPWRSFLRFLMSLWGSKSYHLNFEIILKILCDSFISSELLQECQTLLSSVFVILELYFQNCMWALQGYRSECPELIMLMVKKKVKMRPTASVGGYNRNVHKGFQVVEKKASHGFQK